MTVQFTGFLSDGRESKGEDEQEGLLVDEGAVCVVIATMEICDDHHDMLLLVH